MTFAQLSTKTCQLRQFILAGFKMERDHVNFIVGGCFFCLFLEDIEKYPESYFSAVIKKEWNPDHEVPIKIDRDGRIFRYIVEFHHHNVLPLKKSACIELVRQIQMEADFYNLPSLVEACETYVVSCVDKGFNINIENITSEYCSENRDDLVNVVSELWVPFCIKGSKRFTKDCTILKSSTLMSLNTDELCNAALPISLEKKCERLEISADQLNPELWGTFQAKVYPLHDFAPRMKLELRPYKLVLYKEGGHFTEHRDSVRGENHVGTLVHILNSDFTGGEVVVRQNDREMSITKPGEWIAMYGDALHRINAVTSGTLIALVFDLYHVGALAEVGFFAHRDHVKGEFEPSSERAMESVANLETQLFSTLDQRLQVYDDVVICLKHVFLLCKGDPACLQGGDAVLYQLLAQRECDYELTIVPVKIRNIMYPNRISFSTLEGTEIKLGSEGRGPKTRKTLMVISLEPDAEINYILNYIDELEEYPEAEVGLYLVSGLRICKRDAVAAEESSNAADKSVGVKRAVSNSRIEDVVKRVALG